MRTVASCSLCDPGDAADIMVGRDWPGLLEAGEPCHLFGPTLGDCVREKLTGLLEPKTTCSLTVLSGIFSYSLG